MRWTGARLWRLMVANPELSTAEFYWPKCNEFTMFQKRLYEVLRIKTPSDPPPTKWLGMLLASPRSQ